AKALRGRSLYIQLLCDAVSQHLTQQLNLFPTSQIYSSGGKFYLLIPINKVEKLKQEVIKINEKLLAEFRGLVFLGIGSAKICGDCFYDGNMGDKWKEVSEDLMQDRLQRFKPLIVKNTDFFEPISLHFSDKVDKQFCEVCGRDDVAADLRKTSDDKVICSQCHSLEKLGKSLHTQDHLYFLWKWDKNQQINTGLRIPLLFCDLFILEKSQLENVAIQTANDRIFLEKINHFDNTALTTDLAKNINVGFRFAGIWNNEKNQYLEKLECYQQQEEQVGFDFNNFAECSTGIKRAGILRMDVDNLGQVFVNGLNFKSGQMGSLSRIATLSRQLNLFFSGHLNELLKKYQRTQIIYAGGDDLFLIGSWDELPDVAHEIRTQFTQYCAENPNFTISGGIAMVRGRYPISRAAQLAGEQESKAKSLEYISLKTKQDRTKDTFCFLETAIPWERYEQIVEFRDKIENIIQKADNRAIIDRLRQVVLAMQEFERLSKKQDKDVNEIKQLVMWQKWRWRLVYNLARMADRYPNSDIEQELEYIKTIIFEDRIGDSKLTVSHWLPLPVRWVEFLTRKGRA
ncbi:MAG: type III-A CRISPR-associated protein Cas10/Csm1, partial [Thiotrichaceae bacterium]|nr:type III-A CRISPR-associated protein Cas10/Csm1 [Thiotrichaceae bacterium]